ncbi:hypothetical protein [Asanoa sp. NPDC050611]|uniref:hypothetical protein n=1 Tax=Asanoa sp. NPDC050611 TaxID=3157098 RepID=UPI0033FC7C1F
MTQTLVAELRHSLRNKRWWLLVPLMAVFTLVAFSMNDVAAEMYGNYDPQGDDEVLEQLGVLVTHRYTSGHSAGQLLAMLFAAGLVTREFAGRIGVPAAFAPPGWLAALVAKLAVAVLTSLALAAVAGVVAYALTRADANSLAGYEDKVLANPGDYPYAPSPTEIHTGIRRTLLIGLGYFPIWAVLGVGLGLLVRRLPVAVAIGVIFYLCSVVVSTIAAPLLTFIPTFMHAGMTQVVYELPSGGRIAAANMAVTGALAVLMCAVGVITLNRRAAWEKLGAAVDESARNDR